MSRNIIRTTGYHSFERREGQSDAELLELAPFLCKAQANDVHHNRIALKIPFLGSGFYFWDDDKAQAEWWGRCHYHKNYRILACDFELSGNTFLDVVGSVSDAAEFRNWLRFTREYLKDNPYMFKKFGLKYVEKISVAMVMQALQRIKQKDHQIFPYDIIRISDIKNQNVKYEQLHEGMNDEVLVKCVNIICFYNKKDVPLQSKRLIC